MNIIKKIRNLLNINIIIDYRFSKTNEAIDSLKCLVGKQYINELKNNKIINNLEEVEFSIFSQWGEDGIIQYLINNIDIQYKTFVEFGVENYDESNTRFLLINNNWKGLVMDGGIQNVESIKKSSLYWRFDLTAVNAFITKDNINQLILDNGFNGDIGILSIDLDGNDYWIWEAIDAVSPSIVIVEYNSIFGFEYAVTIPYDKDFFRGKAHYSHLYWGASLKALYNLGRKKGYQFIGCNSAGNNAFFVRKDKLGDIHGKTMSDGFVQSKFRESRAPSGKLNYISGENRLELIAGLKLFNLESNQTVTAESLLGDKE